MTRTVKILVSGRVQGVYFRKFTKSKAKTCGVFGTVKNTSDGKVEIVAQGNSDKLEPFIRWCHKGPITARVDQVVISDVNNQEEFTTFEII